MIQEELALLALGIVPDVPVPRLWDHLARCSGCRRFFEEVHKTAGELASALPLRTPPPSVKNKLFGSLASLPAEAGGEEGDGRAPVFPGASGCRAACRTRAGARRRSVAVWGAAARERARQKRGRAARKPRGPGRQ